MGAGCGSEQQEDAKGQEAEVSTKAAVESKADQIEYNAQDCVELGKYKGLKVKVTGDFTVTDKQVEDYANTMAQYYAQPTYKDTDKKTVEEGDIVDIDYEGKKDGVAFDGGTAQGYHLTIGSGTFIDGFEDGLIGKKVGETVDLNLTFPEQYQSEELAGQDVVFTVTINKIVEEDKSKEFELTDEFVSSNLGYDNVEAYIADVRQRMESSAEASKESAVQSEVIQKLLKNCKVTLPEGLADARVADFEVILQNHSGDDTSLEDYLSANQNMTLDQFKENMETNLKTELILDAIADAENITLDEEAFEKYVNEQMTQNSITSEDEYYLANGVNVESGKQYAKVRYVCDQALDLVIDNAKITYKKK